jgi:hypothetical protein
MQIDAGSISCVFVSQDLAYRMVSKMGWAEGQGLGKNNDGITKHLWTKKRGDSIGIGAENSNDWGAHSLQTNTYNQLLSKLDVIINNSDGSSSSSDSDSDSDTSASASAKKKAATKPTKAAKSKDTKQKRKGKSSDTSDSDSSDSDDGESKKSKGKKGKAETIKSKNKSKKSKKASSDSSESSSSSGDRYVSWQRVGPLISHDG